MSWGKDPTKWAKPITVRFSPAMLAMLDDLVTKSRSSYAEAPTRSSAILRAVQNEFERKGGTPLASDALQEDSRQQKFTLEPSTEGEFMKGELVPALDPFGFEAALKSLDACGAVDGQPGKKNGPCIFPTGHSGSHSNGRRTWSATKRKTAPRRRLTRKRPAGRGAAKVKRPTRAPKKQTRKQTKKAARRGGSR